MKALVLSGGMGTRLRPLTFSIPKQLVPVANKPTLFYGLEAIRDIGITEVGIIIGDRGDQVRAAVGDGSALGLRVTYLPQSAPLGLAHCVTIARDFLGDDDFVMYLGDNVLSGGITDAAEEFRTRRTSARVLVTKVAEPQRYGVAELDPSGRVIALVEKPQEPRSDLALVGVYFFTPAIHDAVASIHPSARGELEITDAIQHLVEQGHEVAAQQYSGDWHDTGSVEGILACNRMLLNDLAPDPGGAIDSQSVVVGTVVAAPGAKVIRSRLEGPLILGADTVVTDSTIGPNTAVGARCRITASSIEESIVLDDASIHNVTGIRDSLIGRWTDIRSDAETPCHRLLIGDHGRVEVAA